MLINGSIGAKHFCPSERTAGPIFGESAMRDSKASFTATQANILGGREAGAGHAA